MQKERPERFLYFMTTEACAVRVSSTGSTVLCSETELEKLLFLTLEDSGHSPLFLKALRLAKAFADEKKITLLDDVVYFRLTADGKSSSGASDGIAAASPPSERQEA